MQNIDFTPDIIVLDEIDSTNSFSMKNIDKLHNHQIVMAKVQSAGRGRFARKWISDVPGNVSISYILKPDAKLSDGLPLENITQYMSVVLCNVLESYGVQPTIKWPNDVRINEEKISGILSELSLSRDYIKGIVIGVGVNLALSKEMLAQIDQPATSLNQHVKTFVDPIEFVRKLSGEFMKDYNSFISNGFNEIKEKYIQKSDCLSKRVSVVLAVTKIQGIAKSITDEGRLILQTEDGSEKEITTGDLSCL